MPYFHNIWRCLYYATLLTSLLASSSTAWAKPAIYQLDPVHTRILFAISHAGFSQAMGTVSGSTGLLQFDPDDWSQSRVEVTVPLDRADLGDAAWNKAIAASGLLDTKAYPQAKFVSTRVISTDAKHADVIGELTLHGITRQVTLKVTFNQLKRHPMPPFRRTAGFSATTTISRAEFGISAWKTMIGDSVQLTIQAEATRSSEKMEQTSTSIDNVIDVTETPGTTSDASPLQPSKLEEPQP